MILVKDLNDLEIGDWIEVYPKNESKKSYKVGEITHKWLEGKKPRFQLKIIRTTLPKSTTQLLEEVSAEFFGGGYKGEDKIKASKKDSVYKLNDEEKTKIIKEVMVESL